MQIRLSHPSTVGGDGDDGHVAGGHGCDSNISTLGGEER